MKRRILQRLSGRKGACIAVILSCILVFAMSFSAFAAENNPVADDPTADNWAALNYDSSEGRTTKNDGRIWTDKSVWTGDAEVKKNESENITIKKIGDESSFLIGLSALSSTMSVDGVTEKPLDIIMVLDVSGSMEESMGYQAVYKADTTHQGTYYIKRNNNYTKLTYNYDRQAWYYDTWGGRQWVTPKASPNDSTDNTEQFYKAVTKMEVLADSVKDFVDTTQNNNEQAISADKQHRISIVKFSGNKSNSTGNTTYYEGGHTYNHSQVVKEFTTPSDDATAESLKDAVDSLAPAGATRADYGMQVAEGLMNDVRSNAQPVVIFFTDGIPTTFSDWSETVANDAIKAAKNMKDDGAWIYSVGVFKQSDLTNNPNLDEYMKAVSSNYPKATGYTGKTMGDMDPDGDYYSTADEADELKAIFAEIAQEISSKKAEMPTHVEEGYDASKGGYVTFVDKLGQYMEVTSVNSVVFDGIEYKNTITNTSDTWKTATSTTDVFVNDEEITNDLGEKVPIGSVEVTIERSTDPSVGDIITVKVPAALIPLAYYNVTVNDEGAVTERIPTTPIRAFYEVGVKDEVDDLLAKPDAKMAEYLAKYTDDEGKAIFYSNAYDAKANKEIGSTVASFVPSKTNDMYYAVDDTLIYQDEACTKPVTRINESATYYYQRVYYVVSAEPIAPKYETVAFSASVLKNVDYAFNEEGQLYVKAGTGRYTRADATDTIKATGANKTDTASKAAAPRWEEWTTEGSAVPVFLGNNGLLKKDVPGTLAISKDVIVPSWSTVDADSKTFEFEVTLMDGEDPVEGTFNAQLKDADGKNIGDASKITTDSEGNATVRLNDGQTLYIYGLAAGTEYKVKETSNVAGFKQTAPKDDSGQPLSATGEIAAGKTSKAAFENTYSAMGVLDGEANLDGKKILDGEGREWRETDKFAFALAPENANNPMPEPDSVNDVVEGMAIATVSGTDEDKAFNFNDITYIEPGTYKYEIREVVIDNVAPRVPGISYSQDVYEVIVLVTDNGNGTLETQVTMKKVGSDEEVESAEFVNTFETDKVSFGIVGLKELKDKVGTYEIDDDDFEFEMRVAEDSAANTPMPKGTEDGVYTAKNKGVSVSFGTIDCSLSKEAIDNAGGAIVYKYDVTEVKGNIPGMQYGTNPKEGPDSYTVTVTLTWDDEDGLLYTITYPGNDNWVTFTNTYAPTPATAEIEGVKYLKGRDWNDGETFKFELKGLDGAPMPAAADGESTYEFAVPRTDAKLDIGVFGQEITFDKPGTYKYTLSEVTGNAGGMTYDKYVSNITVTVTNENGVLKAVKAVDARTDVEVEAGVSGFVNKYDASMTYSGLTVNKTLYGRDMSFGEFKFVIECMNPNAKAKGIAETDARFESGAHEAGETCVNDGKLSGLKFTQEDAGEEFIYRINEVLPSDDDPKHEGIQSNGVTFDETEYWVIIVPRDNGDGTMDATTTIYTDEARENKVGEWDTNGQKAPAVSFVNDYGFKDVTVDTGANAFITKVFEGREWLDSDTFSFKMSVADDSKENTPMPEGTVNGVTTVTVEKPDDGGNVAVVDLGTITFTAAGVYKYDIKEVEEKLPNVLYDQHTAELIITVTDNGRGNLVAAVEVEGATFTNTYGNEITYGDVTTLDVTKSLDGRDLREGQFSFKVVPKDIPSMRKAGMESLEGIEFRNGVPGEDGISHMFSPDQMILNQDDLGKTYTYVFYEIAGDDKAYTYDSKEYTLSFKAIYEDGMIAVVTTVTDNEGNTTEVKGYNGIASKPVVTIAFENSYDSNTTSELFEGKKTMSGRPLEDGEFEFVLAYADDQTKNAVSTTSNDAAGNVVFKEQTYTLDTLAELVENGYATKVADGMIDTYTINYIAFEKAGDKDGVTHTESTFAFTVTVTDDGAGKLTSKTDYPDSGLMFKNEYKSAPINYNVKGLKVLKYEDGLTPDSIEGKFTFNLTAVTDGAPMPEKTKAVNDAYGNVDFGDITFTTDAVKDVEAQDGVRTKTFEYAVTETGSVPGVTNDSAAKTFSITVTDDGKGHMTAVANPAEGPLFTFTNTYETDDVTESITGEGNLKVTKKLNGRDLNAGEFTFELVEEDKVVAEGKNAADGTVTFAPVTYKEPGTHTYTVREVKGSLGGVTYDTTTYQVEAKVTDNGKGKLEVEFGIVDDGVQTMKFTNEYEPASTTVIVAPGKALVGRDLKAGEFQFKITAESAGAPMPVSDVVTNDAEGIINFGQITYDEEGTWEYVISEIKGEVENVTYDETVHKMTVVVTDNGEGQLDSVVTFNGKSEVPVFVNQYKVPENPSDNGTKTGDDFNMMLYLLIALTGLGVAGTALIRRRTN